jgi:hypothetical protein
MKIGAYVINLNRSIARWEGLSRKADSPALDVGMMQRSSWKMTWNSSPI